jgi:hypothetical protein
MTEPGFDSFGVVWDAFLADIIDYAQAAKGLDDAAPYEQRIFRPAFHRCGGLLRVVHVVLHVIPLYHNQMPPARAETRAGVGGMGLVMR